jgi:hypothetical protein
VLALPEHGFHLRFDPRSQRLRLIEVTDLSRLQVACGQGGAVFGGAPNTPSLRRVSEAFGPAWPGALARRTAAMHCQRAASARSASSGSAP